MSVSIIIPYYNHGHFLQPAVQSALAAYSGDSEIIIINDGSKERHADNYLRNVQKLSEVVKVFDKPNGGLSSARNAGIELAKGKYIQFLDSDDLLVPRKIDYQINLLDNMDRAKVSVSSYVTCNHYVGNIEDGSYSIVPYKFDTRAFLYRWERGLSIPIHSGLFKRDVFENIRFNDTVYGKEDWIFWCNLIGQFPNSILYCPFIGAIYRIHSDGMTRSPALMGESWVQATEIISEIFPEQSKEFEKAAMEWHKAAYGGLRVTGPLPHKKDSSVENSLNFVKRESDSNKIDVSCSMLYDNKRRGDPLISIIIPVFNQTKYLDICFKSVFSQTKSENIELIIVDDASTDPDVHKILSKITFDKFPVRIFKNKTNYGIAETQNLAAKFATGKYLAFLDCDDYLSEVAIERVSEKIVHSCADYYFSDKIDINENNKNIKKSIYGGYPWINYSGNIKDDLALGMVASHFKVVKRQSYLSVGGSDKLYSGVQDWKLALDLSIDGSFVYLNEFLYFHRVHENSVTISDSVTQFFLTNKVRREHLLRLTSVSTKSAELTISLFQSPDDVRELTKLKLMGHSLEFDSGGRNLNIKEIDLLREFNSFFDRIALSGIECAALMGYLWDESIVVVQY